MSVDLYQRFENEAAEGRAAVIERYRSLRRAAEAARLRSLSEQYERSARNLRARNQLTDQEVAE